MWSSVPILLLWPTGPARGSLLTLYLHGAGFLSSVCLLPTPGIQGSPELVCRGVPAWHSGKVHINMCSILKVTGYNLQAHMGSNSTSGDRYNSISGDRTVFCIRPHWGSLFSCGGSSFSTFSKVLFYPILSDSDDEISTPHSIQQMSLLEALTVAAVPVVVAVLYIPAVGIELLTDTLRFQTTIRSASYCSSSCRLMKSQHSSVEIKRDFRALGLIREYGTEVIFSPMFPVAGSNFGRNRWSQFMKYVALGLVSPPKCWNSWQGIAYIAPGLLASDGIHCSQSRRSVLTQELVGLIDRTLN